MEHGSDYNFPCQQVSREIDSVLKCSCCLQNLHQLFVLLLMLLDLLFSLKSHQPYYHRSSENSFCRLTQTSIVWRLLNIYRDKWITFFVGGLCWGFLMTIDFLSCLGILLKDTKWHQLKCFTRQGPFNAGSSAWKIQQQNNQWCYSCDTCFTSRSYPSSYWEGDKLDLKIDKQQCLLGFTSRNTSIIGKGTCVVQACTCNITNSTFARHNITVLLMHWSLRMLFPASSYMSA